MGVVAALAYGCLVMTAGGVAAATSNNTDTASNVVTPFVMTQQPLVWSATGPDGSRWVSHDKGATSCVITMPNGAILDVRTSHSVPYRKFDIDAWDEVFSPVRNDMARKLSSRSPLYLYQGDLNHDDASVKQFLPTLFENNLEEVILDHPTTPKGRWYDHVLYRGIKHVRSVVVTDVLTDHFPVYSEFEVPDKVI